MTKKPNDSCLRLLLGMTGLLITSSNGGTLAHGTDRVRYATVQINKISRRFKLRHYPTAPTLRLQRPLFRHTARGLLGAAFSAGTQCAQQNIRPAFARRRGAFVRTSDACADVCPPARRCAIWGSWGYHGQAQRGRRLYVETNSAPSSGQAPDGVRGPI